MLSIAMELARKDPAYEDLASKFFEHFVAICDSINSLGGTGLWDEADGFYYYQLTLDGVRIPLRVRSLVGIIPLFAVSTLSETLFRRLPGFGKRLRWFLENRQDLARYISFVESPKHPDDTMRLLAIPSRERLAIASAVPVRSRKQDRAASGAPTPRFATTRRHRRRCYRSPFCGGAKPRGLDHHGLGTRRRLGEVGLELGHGRRVERPGPRRAQQ